MTLALVSRAAHTATLTREHVGGHELGAVRDQLGPFGCTAPPRPFGKTSWASDGRRSQTDGGSGATDENAPSRAASRVPTESHRRSCRPTGCFDVLNNALGSDHLASGRRGQRVATRRRRTAVGGACGVEALSARSAVRSIRRPRRRLRHASLGRGRRDRTRSSQVVWEIEPGARRHRAAGCCRSRRRLRRPDALDAFLDAVRWGAILERRPARAAGAVPERDRDRGLPARPARPGAADAARQPADRRRRRPRQDDRGRPGRPGAAAAPPRPARPGRLPGRPCSSSGATRCARSSAWSSGSSTASCSASCAATRGIARQPVDALPAADRLDRLAQARAAACGCFARCCPAGRAALSRAASTC